MVLIRLKTISGIVELATSFKNLGTMAHLLEESTAVVAFQVLISGDKHSPKQFGYGGFNKWTQEEFINEKTS